MAMVSTRTYWAQMGVQLMSAYAEKLKYRPNKFFDFFDNGLPNPLASIDPKHEKFFGPKVCILFIICKPYGETPGLPKSFSWPPEGYEYSKDHIKKLYAQWAKFEVNFYGDGMIIKQAMAADPEGGGPKFKELMEQCFEKFEEECNDMRDYGWKWRGRIDSEVPPSHFFEVLDAFYSK